MVLATMRLNFPSRFLYEHALNAARSSLTTKPSD
jgi:hypothetical protein